MLVAAYRAREAQTGPSANARAELMKHPRFRRLPLRPFDRDQITEYLRAIGLDAGERLADRIYARTDGNTPFVAEVVPAGEGDTTAYRPLRDKHVAGKRRAGTVQARCAPRTGH